MSMQISPVVFRRQQYPDIKYVEKRRPPNNITPTTAVAARNQRVPRAIRDNDPGVYNEIHMTQQSSEPSHVTDSQQHYVNAVIQSRALVTSSQQPAESGYEQLHPRLGDGVANEQPDSALRQWRQCRVQTDVHLLDMWYQGGVHNVKLHLTWCLLHYVKYIP